MNYRPRNIAGVLEGQEKAKSSTDYSLLDMYAHIHDVWLPFLTKAELDVVLFVLRLTARRGKQSARIVEQYYTGGCVFIDWTTEKPYLSVPPISIHRNTLYKALKTLKALGILKTHKKNVYLDFSVGTNDLLSTCRQATGPTANLTEGRHKLVLGLIGKQHDLEQKEIKNIKELNSLSYHGEQG